MFLFVRLVTVMSDKKFLSFSAKIVKIEKSFLGSSGIFVSEVVEKER